MNEDVPPGGKRPEARSAVLTYRVGFDADLDPLYIQELAELWASLLASGMPGSYIRDIRYEKGELTVEFQ